ncbi:MAG: DUF3772 domain-containing protein [Pseudomonadota bacterium]
MIFRFFRLFLCLAVLSFASFALTPPAQAQGQVTFDQDGLPDYDTWQRIADRGFEAIESARASTPAFEQLRQTLVDWRDEFQSAQDVNANAINTVQSQLDALGPAPDEEAGETEPEEIANLRVALAAEIARLGEPARSAQIAFTRADGLIRGIDRIIRDRQAEQILALGPSPLLPTLWPSIFQEFQRTWLSLRSEFSQSLSNPLQQARARDNLPIALIEALLGALLVVRGRRWTRKITARMFDGDPGAGRWLAAFGVSTGTFILPFIGVMLLVAAAKTTGLGGITIDRMLDLVAIPVFFFLLARWVGTRVFPADRARTLPLELTPSQRARGRLYAAMLGLLAAVNFFLRETALINVWSDAALAVLMFPFTLICALLLWRLATLLRAHVMVNEEEDAAENYRSRTMRVLSYALIAVSIVSPVTAAAGYFELSQFMLYPTLATLQLLGLLLVLQRLVVEIYVLVTGNRDGASDSLIPILIGFAMTVAALPIFAIFWGARPADIEELWAQMVDGYEIGGILISPTSFLTAAAVFSVGYGATRLLQGAFRTTILPKTRLDAGGRNAVVSGLGYVGIVLAALIGITAAGINLSNLAIVAGALSVGIGFGLQNIVSNFVAGIILLIERPISEGDWVEVGGVHGTIRQISVRSTVITTFDRSDVIVPNSDFISGQVTNYTRSNTLGRLIVPVGVAYGSDVDLVEKILREVAEGHPLVILNPPPAILFRAFGASSLDFEVRVILRDVNFVLMAEHEINHEINRRFNEAGIEIPFAQTDLWLRNPEKLPGARVAAQDVPPPRPTGGYSDESPYRTEPPGHDADTDRDLDRHIDRDRDGDMER